MFRRGRTKLGFSRDKTKKLNVNVKWKHDPQRYINTVRGLNYGFNSVKDIVAEENKFYDIGLVRLTGGIGDILMTLWAVAALKVKLPNSKITYYGPSSYYGGSALELLKLFPDIVDEVMPETEWDNARHEFWADLTGPELDFEKDAWNSPERIDLFCQFLGVKKPIHPCPTLDPKDIEWASEFINGHCSAPNDPVILLSPISNSYLRTIPSMTLKALVEKLKLNGFNVITESYYEIRENKELQNLEAISISKLVCLIEQVDLVFLPDSCPMHIAGIMSTPGVGWFTHVHPNTRLHYYPNIKPYFNEPKCLCQWQKPSDCDLNCMDIDLDKLMVMLKEICKEDEI